MSKVLPPLFPPGFFKPDTFAFSKAQNPDSFAPSIVGAELVHVLPTALGAITKLEIRRGKLVAKTASGITMITHAGKDES